MFGFSDNNVQTEVDAVDPATAPVVSGGSLDQHEDGMTPVITAPTAPAPSSNDGLSSNDYIMTDVPTDSSPAIASDIPVQHPDDVNLDSSNPETSNDDLLALKQSALQELSPLVEHLSQTPEEKFRTTMMLVQASDNQDLLRVAFQSAKEITDEKVRAQAFLDVVNEINYFTQQTETE